MKKFNGGRIISLILVLAMAAALLAGCGSKSSKKSSTMLAELDSNSVYIQTESPLTQIMKSSGESSGEEEALDDMGEERFNFISSAAVNGKYYVMYSDVQSEGKTTLCIFDEQGKNAQSLELPLIKEGGISLFSVLPDEKILLLYSEYIEQKEVFIWQMACYSVEGKEKPALKEVWKKNISDEEDFYPNGIVSTKDDTFLLTETDFRIYNNKDGSEKKTLELPGNFFGSICKTPADKVLMVGMGAEGVKALVLDDKQEKFEETAFEAPDIMAVDGAASGSGEYDFYAVTDKAVYGFKLDSPAPVQVFNYMASDLELESVMGFASLSPDTAILLFYNMDYASEAALFKKGDPAGQGEKTALTMACTYASSDISKAVVNFNKTNENYRIVLKEYPYDDDGNNTLNMQIAAGNIPDMLCITDDMPLESYAAKGMFEDLEPLFTGDKDISRNVYLDNVLDAFRMDGKMYYVTPAFNVIGVIGKKKDFGNTKGVTTTQIEKMMKERDIGYDTVMGLSSRENILSWVLFCALEEYVDWDAGKCSFGTESFINLLKFCAKFPKTINYENINFAKYEAAMREGKQLLRDGYIYSVDTYMQERYGYVGEEIAFMGYPGNGKNGPVVQSEQAIAICSGTESLEGCWEFLRSFYLEDYQNSIEIAFPISRDALHKQFEKAMNPKTHTYEDENGKEVTEAETASVSLNGKEIKIPVPTQEDVDWVEDMLENLDTKVSVDSKISEIINEESGAFFAGQKGAEETADIIQSRVKVYISETK